MIDRVKRILSEYTTVPKRKMTPESRLVGDLGMTSFDLVNAVVAFEDEFDITIPTRDVWQLHQVKDAIDYMKERGIHVDD